MSSNGSKHASGLCVFDGKNILIRTNVCSFVSLVRVWFVQHTFSLWRKQLWKRTTEFCFTHDFSFRVTLMGMFPVWCGVLETRLREDWFNEALPVHYGRPASWRCSASPPTWVHATQTQLDHNWWPPYGQHVFTSIYVYPICTWLRNITASDEYQCNSPTVGIVL